MIVILIMIAAVPRAKTYAAVDNSGWVRNMTPDLPLKPSTNCVRNARPDPRVKRTHAILARIFG